MKRVDPKKLILPALVLLVITATVSVATGLHRAGVSLVPRGLLPGSGDLLRALGLPELTADEVTVLVLGLDDADFLTDVIMVAKLDVPAGEAVLLQLPRDLYVGDVGGVTGKLNGVFGSVPGTAAGAEAVKRVLRDQMDLPVDYYVVVNMATVRDAVDDLGGIYIDLPYEVEYLPGMVLYPGPQTLSGQQAEWLIRTRSIYRDGDLGRMRAQAMFLSAAADTVREVGLMDAAKLAFKYHDRIETDMPVDVMAGMLPVLMDLEESAMATPSVPLLGFAMNGEYSVFVAHRTQFAELLETHFGADPNRVSTPWGPPEPEPGDETLGDEEIADLYAQIFGVIEWEALP